MDDPEFFKITKEIEHEIENNNHTILSKDKSKYNSDVYLDECLICSSKENLEMHHINWQKDCSEDGFIISKPHIKKNHKSNLMPVCQTCHDNIDRDMIRVSGYEHTTKGTILKWNYVNKENRKSKKYNSQDINNILKLKNMVNITQTKAKKLLSENYNIIISTNTIRKIWNNEYEI